MTKEQKEILLKDLCARLPYGVKCTYYDKCIDEEEQGTITGMQNDTYFVIDGVCIDVENVKSYMFPMSSMNERLREEHKDLLDNDGYTLDANGNVFTLQDFYCKYHLDYRGFIPMGLAVDATNLNIY